MSKTVKVIKSLGQNLGQIKSPVDAYNIVAEMYGTSVHALEEILLALQFCVLYSGSDQAFIKHNAIGQCRFY